MTDAAALDEVMMTAAQLCARYGSITPMTLYRWLKDTRLGFPQPLRINHQRYWKASEIVAWESAHARQSTAVKHAA